MLFLQQNKSKCSHPDVWTSDTGFSLERASRNLSIWKSMDAREENYQLNNEEGQVNRTEKIWRREATTHSLVTGSETPN